MLDRIINFALNQKLFIGLGLLTLLIAGVISFKNLPVEDVSFPRSVNGIKEYTDSATIYKKSTPIHAKGALIYNYFLKDFKLTKKYPFIQDGEKIKFVYLKTPNTFNQTVISFPNRIPVEFGINKFVDYDLQFEKTFLDPIKIILDCLGWHTEKQSSLEDFFS